MGEVARMLDQGRRAPGVGPRAVVLDPLAEGEHRDVERDEVGACLVVVLVEALVVPALIRTASNGEAGPSFHVAGCAGALDLSGLDVVDEQDRAMDPNPLARVGGAGRDLELVPGN